MVHRPTGSMSQRMKHAGRGGRRQARARVPRSSGRRRRRRAGSGWACGLSWIPRRWEPAGPPAARLGGRRSRLGTPLKLCGARSTRADRASASSLARSAPATSPSRSCTRLARRGGARAPPSIPPSPPASPGPSTRQARPARVSPASGHRARATVVRTPARQRR